jgi:hypothetical protein
MNSPHKSARITPIQNFSIPKNKNNLDTIYILLLIQKHYKNKEIPKKFWKTPGILCQENYGFLVDLLWNIKYTNTINHPFYEFLAKELIEHKQIKDVWKQVEVFLGTSGKFREIVSVHFAVLF